MLIRMTKQFVAALLLLVPTAPLVAQLEDADAATRAECKECLRTPLPAEGLAIVTPKAWPNCDSYKSYSGIGRKVDFGAARRCAWSERAAIEAGLEPRYTTASVFGGSAMLTVLYANGDGVTRDIPLALRFACEAGGAPAEIGLRVKQIESLREKSPSTSFGFCDDITSGFMQGFCAAYDSEIADQKRADAWKTLIAHWPESQRGAFSIVDKAEQAYAKAHAGGEIDLSGTARGMFEIDAEQTLRGDFLAAVESFEKGKLPNGTAALAAEADAHLNAAYRKALADAEAHKSEYGAVQPDGIRKTERAWLKYRDSWIAFARVHYPGVSGHAWLALLSNDRTSVLDGSFCDMDAMDGPCAQKEGVWKPGPLP